CGPDNQAEADGQYTTTVTDHGRLAWTDGTGPPDINHIHHPEELLGDDDPWPRRG
ncbi:MAG: HNH nuclease, partial [Mycobacterium sp.]